MRGTTHLDHAGGRRRGGGRREAEGARVLRAAFRQHSGGWRSHRSRSCEAVEQDQQEAAAAPAVVSRRRARRLGPSAALVEGARRISFGVFSPPGSGFVYLQARRTTVRSLEFLPPLSRLTRVPDSTSMTRIPNSTTPAPAGRRRSVCLP